MSKKAKSELDEKDLKVMKALVSTSRKVTLMLSEHEDTEDIGKAYAEMQKLLSPKLLERMIKARRLEIEGKLNAGSSEAN